MFAMPRARLTVTLPEGVWIRDVSEANPAATFNVLAAVPDEETGVGLVELLADDLPAVVADLEAAAGVSAVTVLGAQDGRAVVQFETTEPLLLLSARASGVPLEPPIEIRDGVAELSVTASRDRLSALGEQLSAFGHSFDVQFVRQSVADEPLLTDRQREVLLSAVDRGYYDTPRECTLTELAEALGMAKSTASETLHRAEERVVKEFVEGLAAGGSGREE